MQNCRTFECILVVVIALTLSAHLHCAHFTHQSFHSNHRESIAAVVQCVLWYAKFKTVNMVQFHFHRVWRISTYDQYKCLLLLTSVKKLKCEH